MIPRTSSRHALWFTVHMRIPRRPRMVTEDKYASPLSLSRPRSLMFKSSIAVLLICSFGSRGCVCGSLQSAVARIGLTPKTNIPRLGLEITSSTGEASMHSSAYRASSNALAIAERKLPRPKLCTETQTLRARQVLVSCRPRSKKFTARGVCDLSCNPSPM